jgi:uncharacterized protein YciI
MEKRAPFREKHLELARSHKANSTLIMAGATGEIDADPSGGMFVFHDVDSAKSFAANDVYCKEGIVTNFSIRQWTVVVQ